MKKHKLGLICGRFSPIHRGHQSIINTSIEKCDKTLIFIGSAQESGTLRNPFSADFRIDLLRKVYPDKNIVQIEKLEDMTNEYDINSIWGQYVIDKTIEATGRKADAIISGNDESRKDWFSKNQMKNVKEILVDRRKVSISATLLRGYILINDKKEYMKYVPKEIIPEFDRIRRELLKSDIYSLILEEMGENLSIENFKKIYNIYEKEDKKIKMSNI